nr:TPA_asm: P [Heliosperma gammacytorhabdovirus 1]
MNKNKASASKKPSEGRSETEDAKQASAVLGDVQSNAQAMLSGKGELPPALHNLQQVLYDPTSPLMTDAETLSSSVLNVVPNPESVRTSKIAKVQSKEAIRSMVVRSSAELGIVADSAHIEDLCHISSKSPLTEKDVWLYLKGVSRTNQISATTALNKIVKDIETMMSKNQQVMAQGLDSNKLVSERIAMQGQKLESMVPTIGSLMRAEHLTTREVFKQEMKKFYTIPKAHGESSKTAEGSMIAAQSLTPGAEEIVQMCTFANVPDHKIMSIAEKYSGHVSWDEYNLIVSGSVSKDEARKLILGWKGRV